MENLLILVNIILAVILIIVILLQRSEGGALGLGVSQDNFTSARSVGTFLTKFTSIIAALFIICSIAIVAISRDELRETQSVLEQEEQEKNDNKQQHSSFDDEMSLLRSRMREMEQQALIDNGSSSSNESRENNIPAPITPP